MSLSRLRALSLPLCASGNLATRAISEILVSKGLLRTPMSSAALVHRKMSCGYCMIKPEATDEDMKLKIKYHVDGETKDQTFSWEANEESNTHTAVFTAKVGPNVKVHKSHPVPCVIFSLLKKPSLDPGSNTVTMEKTHDVMFSHYFTK